MEDENEDEYEVEIFYHNIVTLRKQRLTWADIARHLDVSINTLAYFRKKYAIGDVFVTIGDDDLWQLILTYQNQDTRWGESMLMGALRSRYYDDGSMLYVPRSQLRRVLDIYDKEGRDERRRKAVYRVTYKSLGVNHAWHLDGWHKLIHYKIVIHGCIDGFSRKIIFLKASTNNRATTVFSSFFQVVRETNEFPALISTDAGGENVLVADYMILHLGSDSIKVVSSVHNQRQERLWRDVAEKATMDYINLFMDLRNEEILNINDLDQLWLIHFLFLDLINDSLQRFILAWDNHSLRTEENNLSPNQIQFFARSSGDIFTIPENVDVNFTDTLLDDFDEFDDNNDIPLVQVSDIPLPFSHDTYLIFQADVNRITIEDMRPGNIEIVKDKWIDAFVLLRHLQSVD